MNETKHFESLSVLAKVTDEQADKRKGPSIASVRVSAGPYLAVASVITFSSALLLRSHNDAEALVLIAIAWIFVPLLALTDRIVFDGVSIRRHGPIPLLLQLFTRYKNQLLIEDIEIVETHAVRTLRRGGSVRYRYSTQVSGKGKEFGIASGGKSYRKLVREMFPLIHQDKLDNRSRDLRDYLSEPKALSKKAQLSQLASTDVLDFATTDFRLGGKSKETTATAQDLERAHLLRRLGNELRVIGRLREAGEAYRRALIVTPRNAWLIYDFARLLRSQASARGDAKLLSRAKAALRLASLRAENDIVLLPLIGESFIECGDTRLARKAFQKSIEIDHGNYKASLGLADLALREGKLAHVIHHYQAAARVNSEAALVRYARRESVYYMLLNDDDDYLSTELRRISWLQNVTRVRRLASRMTNASILVALAGGLLDPFAGSIGCSIASSALVIWLLTVAATRVLFARTKPQPAT